VSSWRGPRAVGLGALVVLLLIAGAGGVVLVLQTRNTPAERFIPLSGALLALPVAPVVDEQSGHVFVFGETRDRGIPNTIMLDGPRATILRTTPVETFSLGPPVLVDARRGHLIVTGNVTILSTHTGAILHNLRQEVGLAALDQPSGHLFVAADAGDSVSMLDASGQPTAAPPVPAAFPRAMLEDQRTRRVFVLNAGDGTVIMLDARDGTLRRTTTTGIAPSVNVGDSDQLALDAAAGHVFASASSSPIIVMLDASSGAQLHTTLVGGTPTVLAVDQRRRRVVVADGSHNRVVVLDAKSGLLIATTPVGRRPGAIVVDGVTGRAFVLNDDNTISVIDTRTGALVRTVTLGMPHAPRAVPYLAGVSSEIAIDVRHGHAFVVDGNNDAVLMLDARDGSLQRTIPVGPRPLAIAADDRRGLAYVVSAASRPALDRWGWLPGWLRNRLPFLPKPPPLPAYTGSVTVIDSR